MAAEEVLVVVPRGSVEVVLLLVRLVGTCIAEVEVAAEVGSSSSLEPQSWRRLGRGASTVGGGGKTGGG